MQLIKDSANMGLVNFTEMLKFKEITIPGYIDLSPKDIIKDMNDVDLIGVVTTLIEQNNSATIFDKADLILSLLFICKKSDIKIPKIYYNNFMRSKSFDEMYIEVESELIIISAEKINNLQLICIEVKADNTVKFTNQS